MKNFKERIIAYKDKNNYLNYGRHIIRKWIEKFSSGKNIKYKVLDVGCGGGYDLLNIKKTLGEQNSQADLYGVEIYEEYIKKSEGQGIQVSSLNIETDSLPYEDGYFDIIVVNQVLEHVKEFFWIIGEINRVLKKGGLLIIGVPNLASLHSRFLLLFGLQPTSIRVLGPHVRGYTKKDLIEAMTKYGGFSVYASAGSNFYPFPYYISKILSKLFPFGSVSLFCGFKKVEQSTFDVFLSNRLETNFKFPKHQSYLK